MTLYWRAWLRRDTVIYNCRRVRRWSRELCVKETRFISKRVVSALKLIPSVTVNSQQKTLLFTKFHCRSSTSSYCDSYAMLVYQLLAGLIILMVHIQFVAIMFTTLCLNKVLCCVLAGFLNLLLRRNVGTPTGWYSTFLFEHAILLGLTGAREDSGRHLHWRPNWMPNHLCLQRLHPHHPYFYRATPC